VGLTRLRHNFRAKKTSRHCTGIELALRGFAPGSTANGSLTGFCRYRSAFLMLNCSLGGFRAVRRSFLDPDTALLVPCQ
jgi:hypothetical protein